MFGLDPLSRPVAIAEILILLTVAAFVGWLLGRLTRSGRVGALRSAIADKEAELADCRQSASSTGIEPVVESVRAVTPVRTAEPASADELTVPLITTDPLAPVYGMPLVPVTELEPVTEPKQPDLPATPPPVEVPPLGAPIPEVPAVLPPVPTPAENGETAVLNRVAARAGELNFDRIGIAAATDADDLKDIVGIGPFLERKLHSLGIYTFRQIGNFTPEDSKQVNEIIEFFPGRIERDNWVSQARDLQERKYGA